jgi:outer membrane receptor protein involved in Fe transport
MKRFLMLSSASVCLSLLVSQSPAVAGQAPATDTAPEQVLITGRLNEARAGLETQIGASTYTLDLQAIDASPGAANDLLNRVILQAPDVAQDSFGQFHVRGEHAEIQYRLNGIILPEGISVFGQTLDPRFIQSLKLITGALPAEYGLRTAGIIDLTTKNGALTPGGEVSLYGGSHGTIIPSFDYAGSSGNLSYAVTGDFVRNNLGIESPDGSPTPLHDQTNQFHGFGYFEDILDSQNRITMMLGTSTDNFQIPDRTGLQPDAGLVVNGQSVFPSEKLNENQREITHYGIVSYQHSQGNLDFQISGISRYSSLAFSPDQIGDLLYNGISQQAYKRDVAFGLQGDSSYRFGDTNTVRAGLYIQNDQATSRTRSLVLPTDDAGNQTSDVPLAIIDNSKKTGQSYSFYLQDEWVVTPGVTVNFGARYDTYKALDSENQISPRVNVVWQPLEGTTIHAGYSRYFSPPPFEQVANETVLLFQNTTAAAPNTLDDTPKAERANYFDAGAQQKLFDVLTIGVDTYYKKSRNMIDEGQFGAPIILTPFNYLDGKQYGMDVTLGYADGPLSAYANVAFSHALGRHIVSSQFNFSQDDLDYIATNYIHTDHDQALSASVGASYIWEMTTRFSVDTIIGTGVRTSGAVPNGGHVPGYVQVNLGISHDFDLGSAGLITLRGDVINVLDHKYEIRDGTGIGVGAPQFGPRRGFFAGISKSF